MAAIVFTLLGLMALVLARAVGLNWQDIPHWTGELLLVLGILLAAKGISDVTRDWTGLPGFWGTSKQNAKVVRARAASLMWAAWNRIVRWGWLARRLNLRPHERGITAVGGVAMAKASVSATGEVIWGPPPVNGTTEERLAWRPGVV